MNRLRLPEREHTEQATQGAPAEQPVAQRSRRSLGEGARGAGIRRRFADEHLWNTKTLVKRCADGRAEQKNRQHCGKGVNGVLQNLRQDPYADGFKADAEQAGEEDSHADPQSGSGAEVSRNAVFFGRSTWFESGG